MPGSLLDVYGLAFTARHIHVRSEQTIRLLFCRLLTRGHVHKTVQRLACLSRSSPTAFERQTMLARTASASVVKNVAELLGHRRYDAQKDRIVEEHDADCRDSNGTTAKESHRLPIMVGATSEGPSLIDAGLQANTVINPFILLRRMTARNWMYFSLGGLAIFSDHFDLFAVVVPLVKLATFYNVSQTQISSAVTLLLLSRSIAALLFGLVGESSGHRYPLALNCFAMAGVQILSIHMPNATAFFCTRGVIAMEMGSMWGSVGFTILEECPKEARPVLRCIYDMLGSLAFMTACGVNWATGSNAKTWKTLFRVAAGLSFGTGFVRLCIAESPALIAASKERSRIRREQASASTLQTNGLHSKIGRHLRLWLGIVRDVLRSVLDMVRTEWPIMLYLTVFTALLSFARNAMIDTYITFLLKGKQLSNRDANLCGIVVKAGGLIGSGLGAWSSQFIGQRQAVVLYCLLTCFLTPAAMLPNSISGICAGGFFIMLTLHSATSIFAFRFEALTPKKYLSAMPILVFHVGSVIACPATQIANALAEHHLSNVTIRGHKTRVQAYTGILIILVASFSPAAGLWTALGPDRYEPEHDELQPPEREMRQGDRTDVEGITNGDTDALSLGKLTCPVRGTEHQHQDIQPEIGSNHVS